MTTIPIIPVQPLGCDGCTLCCKLKAVDELGKPVGSWCAHCTVGTGCSIWNDQTKPAACGDWECVWLQSQRHPDPRFKLAPDLRPDRCHVVIDLTTDGKSLVMHVGTDRPDAWRSGPVRRVVEAALARDGRVFIACGDSRKMLQGQPA